jgi:hypothetical protein
VVSPEVLVFGETGADIWVATRDTGSGFESLSSNQRRRGSSISVQVLMPSILVSRRTSRRRARAHHKPMLLTGTDWTEVTAVATGVLVAVTAALAVAAIFAETLAQGREWAAMGSNRGERTPAEAARTEQPQ